MKRNRPHSMSVLRVRRSCSMRCSNSTGSLREAVSVAVMCAEFHSPRLSTHKFSPSPARHAWEKVPEGRMRALCSSSIDTSDSFCYKNLHRRRAGRQEEPSPGLRYATGEGKICGGPTDCSNFSPDSAAQAGEGEAWRQSQ